jgi:hypothetical protein
MTPEDMAKLTLASADDLADSLAFALNFEGRKRVHDADAFMAQMVAKRLVKYLDRAGYVVMKKPPTAGHACLARAERASPLMRRRRASRTRGRSRGPPLLALAIPAVLLAGLLRPKSKSGDGRTQMRCRQFLPI